MSFLNWFKTKAHPISVNVSDHSQLIRNVNRLANLYKAMSEGDKRLDVVAELELRRAVCSKFGHEIPYTLEQAVALQTRLNRNAN